MKMKRETAALDETGWNILEELQKNARISFKELAKKVNLSPTATVERVKRMEEEGVIVDYRATVDPRKVGYTFSAMLNFQTNYGNPDPVVGELIKDIPEVISSWSITGSNDFLMEIHVPTLEFLQELLIMLSRHGKITTSIVLPGSTKKGLIHAPRGRLEDSGSEKA